MNRRPSAGTTRRSQRHPAPPASGAGNLNRRDLVVGMLVVQAAVLVAVVGGAPFGVRLALGLAYVCAVPGFALVGLLRLSDPASEVATSLAVSLMVCTATAQGLVWAGRYSLAATLAVLGAVSTLGLLRQLHTLPRPAVA